MSGRIPTELGLRMFVDGLLEVKSLDHNDREKLNQSLAVTKAMSEMRWIG